MVNDEEEIWGLRWVLMMLGDDGGERWMKKKKDDNVTHQDLSFVSHLVNLYQLNVDFCKFSLIIQKYNLCN